MASWLPERVRRLRTSHPLLAFVLRRLGAGVVTLVALSALIFAATQVLPGDVARAVLGRTAPPSAVAAMRRELGLNRPILDQYATWANGAAHGNLGHSLGTGLPVTTVIDSRIGNSATLAILTFVLMVPLAIGFGVWSGVRHGGIADNAVGGTTLALIALPEFVVGTLLVAAFAVSFHLLPAISLPPPGSSPLRDPRILVLPVVTLLLITVAYSIRMVRAGVIDAMSSKYVEAARLRGIPEGAVIFRHALRNSIAPAIQVFALALQWLIGGLVIVETIFAYPGLGQTLVEAVASRDIPLVQGTAMVIAAFYIGINILADLLVILVIPKLRTSL